MNESVSNNSPGQQDEPNGPLAGQRLAEARRANDISISEIAKELHLDEPKVQALEENQFGALGAPVFAKGHLRKYAELVGVPIDDVLADYYKLNRAVGAPPVVGRARKQPKEISLGPWIVGIVVAMVIGSVVYWWFSREPSETATTVLPGTLAPFASEDLLDDSTDALAGQAADSTETEVADGIADESPAPPATEAVDADPPAPVAETPPAADQVRLTMTFSGDCWTEVTDADGNRLFFGLGQAGRTVSRDGTPPLRALFGDRSNVSVTVNGTEFPLSGDGRRGNTARVTIDAP